MTDMTSAASKAQSVTVARMPVFNDRRRLWGYELFCVGSDSTGSGLSESESVAVSVASGVGLQQTLGGGRKIIVSFNEKSVLDRLPYALPPGLAAVKVEEQSVRGPAVAEVLHKLKSDGYLIAVADYTGDPFFDPVYRLSDIIGIEIRDGDTREMAHRLAGARAYGATLLASRVNDPITFGLCRELGFSLFHGAFFKSPDKVTIRRLTSNEMLRLELLRFIEQEHQDFARLAEAIQADATVSFRLLAYLNSAAFGFRRQIKSVRQAITLLGWRNVKNWLRVVLLSDMSQAKNSQELVVLSAQRGIFLELVGREHDFWGFDPESLHLLGVFSLLDTLLAVPMTEVITYLPLEHKLKAALCREPNNEYLPLLDLATCLEEARWPEAAKLIQDLSLDGKKVRRALQDAVDWAGQLTVMHAAA